MRPSSRVTDPAEWVGRVFPRFEDITIDASLNDGVWEIIFFRRDCASCREVIRELRTSEIDSERQVACVDISLKPRHGMEFASISSGCMLRVRPCFLFSISVENKNQGGMPCPDAVSRVRSPAMFRGFSASIHGTTSNAAAIRGPFACLSFEEQIPNTISIKRVSDLFRLAIIKRAHNPANPEGFPHTIAGNLPWYQRPEIPRHLRQACRS